VQIIPGVYLVNGFPYGQHQNGYLVKSDEAVLMIDSGDLENDTFDLVKENCLRWGIDLGQVSHLFVTHAHFDHSSHAARLKDSGVKIVSNRDCAQAMAAGDERCLGYAVHRTYEPCEADLIIEDKGHITIGDLTVRCIPAPGHAESCTIYDIEWNGRSLWFVGDVIITGAECRSVELGWTGGPDYDRSTYLATLRKLSRMKCSHLFPGHGPPCLGRGRELVEMAYTKAMLELR
jgi:glyoxylase-like metal-dependent hydrolase (beta-lactamase superfamily II)